MQNPNFVTFLQALAGALGLADQAPFLEHGLATIHDVEVKLTHIEEAPDTGILCFFLIGEIMESHVELVLTSLLALNLEVDTRTEGVFGCDPATNFAYLTMHAAGFAQIDAGRFAARLVQCASQALYVRQNIIGFSAAGQHPAELSVALA